MHNQLIEAWWSMLRKHNAQYWMNVFQMLKEDNLFDGSFLDKSLIQFCSTPLIQKELDQVCLEWNVHRIRKTRNANAPAGRPAIMYEMPSLHGVSDHIT
ncbi:unnamed protein product [Ceutorhynchus assimilis]|uniref:Integrase core domain-containing protein n=1 Tax=Ceutorhynchus assimilis TaxID=467358 RepID=A0A9N9MH14_9CUCU|nr:unnamed protein product [Ceutorhynchus assimilis]